MLSPLWLTPFLIVPGRFNKILFITALLAVYSLRASTEGSTVDETPWTAGGSSMDWKPWTPGEAYHYNESTRVSHPPASEDGRSQVFMYGMIVMLVLGCIGNILSFIIMARHPFKGSTTGVTAMLIGNSVVYCLLMSPLVASVVMILSQKKPPSALTDARYLCTAINNAVNFYLYCITTTKFRTALKELFVCHKMTSESSTSISSASQSRH